MEVKIESEQTLTFAIIFEKYVIVIFDHLYTHLAEERIFPLWESSS